MNKQGNSILFFMIGIVALILLIALSPVIKEQVDTSMDGDNLDCDNADTTFESLNCMMTDSLMFFFAITLAGIAGIFILSRSLI